MQLTEKKNSRQFKTLDSTLQTVDPITNEKQAVTYRCIDIDKMVPSLMGVSKVRCLRVVSMTSVSSQATQAAPLHLQG
jgi:hypothetical protein